MRALVIYESMWGNTAKIAEAIAVGLGEARAVDVGGVSVDDLLDLGLLVVGGPTHAFSMTRPATRHDARSQGAALGEVQRGIRELLAELPANLSVPVATFDTRVVKVRRLPGSAAAAASKELRRHHHADVVARESFFVSDSAGPLVDGELERAESWGRAIAGLLAAR